MMWPRIQVRDADALLLAVHWSGLDDVQSLVVGFATSGAEALAAKVPGAHVVSAFSTIPSEVLFSILRDAEGNRGRTLFIAATMKGRSAQPQS
jgi:predicted dinucleotide-binding enzyme